MITEKKLPNFLIVGAAKCGTTSLHLYLQQHPEIFMARNKECRFFSQLHCFNGPGADIYYKRSIRDLTDYLSIFQSATSAQVIGESSPDYLYFYQRSIKNIKQILHKPKIVIMLRNPVERAFSNYLHLVRGGWETLSFEEALKEEEGRKKTGWLWVRYYKDIGFYSNQVKAYLENFSQVKVYLYDDYKRDNMAVIKDVFDFLGVDTRFVPDTSVQYNVSGIPKNKLLYRLIARPNFIKMMLKPIADFLLPKDKRFKIVEKVSSRLLYKPQMKEETIAYLKSLYREDILKLQDLLKRDLSCWLKT